MIIDFNDINPNRFDAFIIGSGPAGSAVAMELSRLGRRSLIIEAGAENWDISIQQELGHIVGTGHLDGEYFSNHWVRSMGGTSALWGGWCAPLMARNFANWPITRGDLDDCYIRACDILHRPSAFLDYSASFVDGFKFKPFSGEEPRRFATEDPNIYTSDERITIVLEVSARRLRPRHDRTGIEAIEVWSKKFGVKEINVSGNQAIILAGGGMGNVQVLFGSETTDAKAIGNESDQLGRNLMEHPHFYNCGRAVLPAEKLLPKVPPRFGAAYPAIIPDDNKHDEIGLDSSIEFVDSKLRVDDPLEVFVASQMQYKVDTFDLNVRSEMAPSPSNRVLPMRDRDPSGLPRLNTRCVFGSDDLQNAERILMELSRSLASVGLGRIKIVNDAIYRSATGGGHILGTTRMGADPRSSVVDRNCRVHGYGNLFVAGSSVFPTGGYANPTLTIVALAVKLARYVAGSK